MIAADTGRPLVQHVVSGSKCKHVRNIIVATDDQRIVQALKPFGTIVTMTARNIRRHRSHLAGGPRMAGRADRQCAGR